MKFISSKSPERLTEKMSDYQFKTICDWLRTVQSQNARILRLLQINEASPPDRYFTSSDKQTILESGEL